MNNIQYPVSFLDTPSQNLRTLTESETAVLVKSLFADLTNPIAVDNDLIKDTIYDATIVHRLDCVGVHITPGLLLMLIELGQGRPGFLVMWAYTISHIARNTGKKLIASTDWADAFPFGIPTQDAYKSTWEAQKVPPSETHFGLSDNYLDRMEYWS